MPKVLLVEDNEVNLDMLSRCLQSRGYEVLFAVNAAEGVSKTLSDQPDLVLMDINLPGMNAWEATQQLKANPQSQNIPVIALTACAIAGDSEKALAAGCDDYDTKPIDLPRLLEKIEVLLKTKSQRQEPIAIPQDSKIQHALLTLLCHELSTPINAIIGYSEMLLDELKSQPDSTLFRGLQKIYACGTQLLTLANVILDSAQLQVKQLYTPVQRTTAQNIDTFDSTIHLELLTPLNTIIGYCEMLLEEAAAELIPDLNKIHTAAQHLLSMVNNIVNSGQQLQAIDANGLDVPHLMMESLSETSLVENADTIIHTPSEENPWAAVVNTLLVVDDNETNCHLLKRQLERQGYTVATATNGPLALQMLQAMSYDLILLDICMPGMNGFEVLQQLKRHQEWRHIPVIVLSALDEIDNIVRCVEMGAEDYVSKPFKPVLLRAKIAACLEKKRLRDQQILTLAQRSIAEATPLSMLISRLSDGAILYANATAGATFGLPVQELLNRHTQDFYFHPAERQELLDALSRAESIQCRELRCQRADGTPFWVTASLQPLIFNGEATVLYALCDITERKQTEDALRLAEQKYRSIFENSRLGIYQSKRARQVKQITQTDYFQQLKAEAENLRFQDDDDPETAGPKVLLVEDNVSEFACNVSGTTWRLQLSE